METFSTAVPLPDSFCTKRTESADEKGYRLITLTSGFAPGGKFSGFVWVRVFREKDNGEYDVCRIFGMADEMDVNGRADCLWFSHGAYAVNEDPFCGRSFSEYDRTDRSSRLLADYHYLRSGYGILVYCGAHENEVYDGLGSVFYHNRFETAELPGFWQDGELTHVILNGRFLNVGTVTEEEDVQALYDLYMSAAQKSPPEAAGAFLEKAMQLSIRAETEESLLTLLQAQRAGARENEAANTKKRLIALYARLLSEEPGGQNELAKKKANLEWELSQTSDDSLLLLEQFVRTGLSYPESISWGGPDSWRQYQALLTLSAQYRDSDPDKAARYQALAKEAYLHTFGSQSWYNSYSWDHGDFDDTVFQRFCAFFEDGKAVGFAFETYEHTSTSPGGDSGSESCGLLKKEYEYSALMDRRVPTFAYTLFSKEPLPEELLKETAPDGTVTFFGMQQNGKRHGLGIEFLPDGTERKGLWQEGVLTHLVKENRLIPVSPEHKTEEGLS